MKAFSLDLRTRVLDACDEGDSTTEVAERFAVSPAWVRRLKQRRRETGIITPKPRPGRRSLLHGLDDQLLAAVAAQPDITLAELRQSLQLTVAISTLCVRLKRLGLTRKKSRSGQRSRTDLTS